MSSITVVALVAALSGGQDPPDPATARPSTPVVSDVAFRPSSDGLVSVTTDGSLQVHSAPEARVTGSIPLHDGAIRALAVSTDPARAATAGVDGRVRVVDLETLEPLVDVAHDVLAVGFSTDGRTLRAVTAEGELLALDPATGALRDRKPCPDTRKIAGAWIFGDLVVQAYEDG